MKVPRSLMARIAEAFVRRTNPGYYDSAEAAEKYLRKRARAEAETPFVFDAAKCGRDTRLVHFHGMRVIVFGDENDCDYTVLYLHGGAWVNDVHPRNLVLCRKLSAMGHACTYLPLYPLAPNHTCEETYALITELYRELLAKKKTPVTLMGDSAGASIVLVLAQMWRDEGLELPEHLIAISPCVDLSMTLSDYGPYEAADPLLRRPGIVTFAKAWAGGKSLTDPRVSPFYGDCTGLPDTMLMVGTREIFYPDVIAFAEKMRAEGVSVRLEVGEGLNHDYPGYPIPEARRALRHIYNEVGRRKTARAKGKRS